MVIPLDRSSPVPLYRQIQDFLGAEILSGVLPPHTRLPASRELASSLGVNRLTCTTAYDGLEAEGLVYGRQGSGTYVAPVVAHPGRTASSAEDWPLWQQELLSRAWLPAQYELDRMAAALDRPDAVSFAAGMGDSSLFPVDDFRRAVLETLRRDGPAALGYGERAGFEPLRATIARILTERGIPALPGQILVTSGSQQGLSLVARLLLRPGDVVLVECPTYAGAIDLFRSLDVRLAGVPVDHQGLQVDHLEELLQTHRPRLIYCMPTYQNPTGACLSLERRRRLIALADRYNVPILEDEFAGDLRYDGQAQVPLAALDPGGRVIYMGTFSKILMPGLRLGFLLATGPVYERLLAGKRVDDLSSSSLIQRALEAYITVGRYQAHLRRACQLYRRRRDAMADALSRHLPADAGWLLPEGGLFIWLRLPGGLTGGELVQAAAAEGVGFAPGDLFFPGGRPQPYVRLNFAEHAPETIEEGVRRLGKAVTRCLAEKGKTGPDGRAPGSGAERTRSQDQSATI
jgi:GntR family transcriptional regulator / MocR family aminotransferase